MTVSSPSVRITCNGGFPVCTYSTTSAVLQSYNPNNASNPQPGKSIEVANAVPLTGSGFGCPTSGTWSATYHVTADNNGGSEVYVEP